MSDQFRYPTPSGGQALAASDRLVDGVVRRRIVAFLLDGLILAAICGVLWLLLFTFGLLTLGLGLPLLGLLPVVPVAYNWLGAVSGLSATPGQRIMGLMVRRADDLGPPGGLQAAIWVGGFVLTISLGAVWFAIALLTDRHRTLHDIVSGLVVVRAGSLTKPAGIWDAPHGGETFV